jgi:hypothetical protein
MAQGVLVKKKKAVKSQPRAKQQKQKAITKKGARAAPPKRKAAVADFEENMVVTKTINKHNEAMISAKAVQAGGRLKTSDLQAKGKETAKEIKRTMLKKKSSKLEETLRELKAQEAQA